MAINNLEISFYTLGAIPTLPSVAWGSLRFGLRPELFALAALVNGFVFTIFAVMYLLMRFGIVRSGIGVFDVSEAGRAPQLDPLVL